MVKAIDRDIHTGEIVINFGEDVWGDMTTNAEGMLNCNQRSMQCPGYGNLHQAGSDGSTARFICLFLKEHGNRRSVNCDNI